MLPLGLLPNSVILPWIPAFLRNDKLLHFAMFSLFSAALIHALDTVLATQRLRYRACYAPSAASALALGASFSSEYLQSVLSNRRFDAIDIAYNLLGSAVGILSWYACRCLDLGALFHGRLPAFMQQLLESRRCTILVGQNLASFDPSLELGMRLERWDATTATATAAEPLQSLDGGSEWGGDGPGNA
ncbi:hypothetical protein BJ741DRAFT_594085 [Chytriomyces cf. hyalinus JEL632]|nr:hypothetical protein BJ741DRAFT_594085 [Chytriomyces cf. hyalinus JEL632]